MKKDTNISIEIGNENGWRFLNLFTGDLSQDEQNKLYQSIMVKYKDSDGELIELMKKETPFAPLGLELDKSVIWKKPKLFTRLIEIIQEELK